MTLALATLFSCSHGPNPVSRIMSRGKTLERNSPWQGKVAYLSSYNMRCTGAVMEDYPRAIITAGHCVQGEERIWVSFPGDPKTERTPMETTRWHIHPGYQLYRQWPERKLNTYAQFNDLAVVLLPEDAPRVGGALGNRPYYDPVPWNSHLVAVSLGESKPINPYSDTHPALGSTHGARIPEPLVSNHTLKDFLSGDMTYVSKWVLEPHGNEVMCPGDSGAPVLLPQIAGNSGPGDLVAIMTTVEKNSDGTMCGDKHSYTSKAVSLAPHRWWLQWALQQPYRPSFSGNPPLDPLSANIKPMAPLKSDGDPPERLVLECVAPLGMSGAERVVFSMDTYGSAHVEWGSSDLTGYLVAQAHAKWRVENQHLIFDWEGEKPWTLYSALRLTFPAGPLVVRCMAHPNWSVPIYSADWWESSEEESSFDKFQCFMAHGPRFLDVLTSSSHLTRE